MRTACLLLPLLTIARPLFAEPFLTSVFPMSCQSGQQVEVTLSGNETGNATELVFSVPDVSAKAVGNGKFLVQVGAQARPRDCDVWCIAGGRLSNPRRFVISPKPCVVEQSGNDMPKTAQTIPLPGAVDGRLEAAAKIDWYQFDGKAGRNVTLICRSRTLDGSVEPVVSVIGPSGRELAHSSGRRREPIVTLTLPSDGRYRIRVADRAYRKNVHSFYRLELLTGMRVLGCFPNLLQSGKNGDVALFGFGLAEADAGRLAGRQAPLTRLSIRVPVKDANSALVWQNAVSAFPRVSLGLPPNTFGFAEAAFVDFPVTVEAETKTESIKVFQELELPVVLNGRFDRRGDIDWFAFSAKKGESIRIDLYGDRLGHRMDLDAAILDAAGKILVTFPDAGAPKGFPAVLSTASLDVSAVWKIPDDAKYRLVVRDLYGGSLAGADRSYVLNLRTRRPSFRVFVLPPDDKSPAGLTVPRAGHVNCRLFAVRQDGFKGAIRVTLREGKQRSGVSLGECWIGPAETSAIAILSATEDAIPGPRFLRLRAESKSDVELIQVPVSVTTLLSNSSAAGRLVDRAAVAVSTKEPLGIKLTNSMPTVAAGQKLNLTVRRSHLVGTLKAAAKIEFLVLPTGMKSPAATLEPNAETTTVAITVPQKLAAGRYSIAASVTATVVPTSEAAAKPKERTIRIWSNSVVFEVVPSS